MFECAERLPTLARHPLSPMTLRVQRAELAQPVTTDQPTLMVLRRGHVTLRTRMDAAPRAFGVGWASLDPAFADHGQERWSARDESLYQALELPAQACADLLQREVPWALPGQRPLRFNDPKVAWWVDDLVQHCAAGEPHGALYTESVGAALVSYLATRAADLAADPRAPTRLPHAAVQRIRDHVDAHLAGALPLKDLAALCGCSPGHLNRVFKDTVGLPLHRFVTDRRLAHARRLLVGDQASMADIAVACGFASQAHFSTAFRRHLGCTPSAFRGGRGSSD